MLRAIFREWCSQIEKLMGLGIELSHLDAHHHVHTIPQMLPVLAALRRRYKIKRARLSRNLYSASEHPTQLLLQKKKIYNLALRVIGFRTTRIFTDMETFVKQCATEPPRVKSLELMTHPGSLPRTEEANLLESDWPSRLSYRPTLVSYKSL
jgi:predicted glycoside hydrolase/deacetylase ChbG (UPF0249 family)